MCCSFYFILYKKHYEKVNIDCPIICLICVSQYAPQVGHEAEMFIFFPVGTSKERKEVTARQCALSKRATRDCICFSSIGQCMDSICH